MENSAKLKRAAKKQGLSLWKKLWKIEAELWKSCRARWPETFAQAFHRISTGGGVEMWKTAYRRLRNRPLLRRGGVRRRPARAVRRLRFVPARRRRFRF